MLLTVQAQRSRAWGRRKGIIRLQRWRLSLQGAPWLQRTCACNAAELFVRPASSIHCFARLQAFVILDGIGAHCLNQATLSETLGPQACL